jgi:hypothetical protein
VPDKQCPEFLTLHWPLAMMLAAMQAGPSVLVSLTICEIITLASILSQDSRSGDKRQVNCEDMEEFWYGQSVSKYRTRATMRFQILKVSAHCLQLWNLEVKA